MKLEITFDELNSLISKYTKHKITARPLLKKDSFAVRMKISIMHIEIPLTYDRIIDGHKVAFDYKLPLGMNLIAGKFKDIISSLIRGRIAEIDHQQIVVQLTRIESMERYFEHFEVSHFEINDNVIKLHGKLK